MLEYNYYINFVRSKIISFYYSETKRNIRNIFAYNIVSCL